MADDDRNDPADALGAEHFPTCACFSLPGRCVDERINMYVTAQEYANGLVSNMMEAGVCDEAMPYFIALFENMCTAMIASAVTSRENQKVTPEGVRAFGLLQRDLYAKIRERGDALMRRADRINLGMGQGTDRVQ